MIFENLGIRQFRNIKTQDLKLNSGLNVFRGQNGQGKTNLIESLYILTSGRSFRTSRIEDLACKDVSPAFQLVGLIKKKGLDFRVEAKFNEGKKSLKVNNNSWTAPKFRQNFPSLLFSPESLLIVKDSAQKRRDLIDDLCLSLFPQFAQVYADYKKALKQKAFFLKKVRDRLPLHKTESRVFENLTQILFEKGAVIASMRSLAIEEIEPLLLEEFLAIMDEHYGNISINYLISGSSFKGAKKEEFLNAMYNRWDELKARELASGLCLVGPHKHDIQFNFNGQEARFYCSQGQQRAIILAFKMAQTKLHYRAHKEFPILLLDDVLSELDKGKQIRFVNYLLTTEAQIFLTTTDATSVPNIAAPSVFEVKEGVFGSVEERVLMGGLSV